ncbi:MAG: DUF3037 domain-containing protein [Pedobacter sp.]|nr:MAG: DUF3037 domain-containing protein [Pedobacter sp.]
MLDKQLFEYAVLRVVPRVEREEFMNIGIILYCAKAKFIASTFVIDEKRLLALCPEMDIAEIQCHAEAFSKICVGKGGGPIGELDMPSRFRWLTATRSTVFQSSKVHPGFCTEPSEMLERLKEQLVL